MGDFLLACAQGEAVPPVPRRAPASSHVGFADKSGTTLDAAIDHELADVETRLYEAVEKSNVHAFIKTSPVNDFSADMPQGLMDQ